VAGPERVHRSRHALPAPDAGPGPPAGRAHPPTEVTGLRILRKSGHPYGPRPRPAPAPGHPGAGRGPAGGRVLVPGSRCGLPFRLHGRSDPRCAAYRAAPSRARPARMAAAGCRVPSPPADRRPATGPRAGRSRCKDRGDRDDHPDMLVRGEPDDQFGVVGRRAAAGSGTPISAGNCAASRWARSSPSAQRTTRTGQTPAALPVDSGDEEGSRAPGLSPPSRRRGAHMD
jgi:hypothetical protein